MNPNAGEFTPEFPPPGGISAAAPAAVPAPAKGAWGKGPPSAAAAPAQAAAEDANPPK
jgi:hypothetical protein